MVEGRKQGGIQLIRCRQQTRVCSPSRLHGGRGMETGFRRSGERGCCLVGWCPWRVRARQGRAVNTVGLCGAGAVGGDGYLDRVMRRKPLGSGSCCCSAGFAAGQHAACKLMKGLRQDLVLRKPPTATSPPKMAIPRARAILLGGVWPGGLWDLSPGRERRAHLGFVWELFAHVPKSGKGDEGRARKLALHQKPRLQLRGCGCFSDKGLLAAKGVANPVAPVPGMKQAWHLVQMRREQRAYLFRCCSSIPGACGGRGV
jgi:hypothetical protein